MSYRWRRRLSLILLLIWLPIYVVVAISLLGTIERLPWALELMTYVVLGIGWALPFRMVFRGVGQVEAPAPQAKDPGGPGS